MALKVTTNIPYGNARDIQVKRDGDMPEVSFAADPQGGPESLWFCLQCVETKPEEGHPEKLRLVLKYFENMLGASRAATFMPVHRYGELGWVRMKPGKEDTLPDGQRVLSWEVNYPNPSLDIAFCFPYGMPEIKQLFSKSKGYWKSDTIGLSQRGRKLMRLSNDYGKVGGRKPGLYLIARQHSGETPGSWVLDGMLHHFASGKKNPFLIWVVPFANVDGVSRGEYGKDNFPYDLNRGWGNPPMRHENLVIRRDMERWQERCRSAFAIDFHAPGACETAGIYCFLPDPEKLPEFHKRAIKWTNVIKDVLSADYAAEEFTRVVSYPSRWETPNFTQFCAETLKLPAISMETPYAMSGKSLLSPKRYREAGRQIASALATKA